MARPLVCVLFLVYSTKLLCDRASVLLRLVGRDRQQARRIHIAKRDGLLAKLELEVPDEVKLAQAEVELTPAFMTKSGGPYKCTP